MPSRQLRNVDTLLEALPYDLRLLLGRPPASLTLPRNNLDPSIRIIFLPGIKHGICHRLISNEQLMPGSIAGQSRDGEVARSCRLHSNTRLCRMPPTAHCSRVDDSRSMRGLLPLFEEKFPEIVASQPALLAHHSTEAGLIEKAVSYWLKAGQQSVERSAMTQAVAQLRNGLDLISDVPDVTRRQELELNLQIALGRALLATAGYAAPAVGKVYARAGSLCEQLNRRQQLAPVIYGQWLHYLNRAELELALPLADELRISGETDEVITWTQTGCRASGITLIGKLLEARSQLEHALHSIQSRGSAPVCRGVVSRCPRYDASPFMAIAFLPWLPGSRCYPS